MVICPTLWRRGKVEKLIESWEATPRAGQTDLALITDRADPSYQGLTLPRGVRIWQTMEGEGGEMLSTADKTNIAAAGFWNDYRALMSTGDDAWFMTTHWDKLLLDPIADRPGFTYPDMTGREVGVPGICVISSPIVRALKWMFLPGLRHYWADNVWQDLGQQSGGTYKFIKECVFLDAYGPHDPTYTRAQSSSADDNETYKRWRTGPQFAQDIETVRKTIHTYTTRDSSC